MVKGFAMAGGIIPVALMLIKFIELKINPEAIPYSALYGFYLWPTSILLLGSSGAFDLRAVVWLLISILANVFIYSIIGFSHAQSIELINKVRNAKR